jgi:hypothetical protein
LLCAIGCCVQAIDGSAFNGELSCKASDQPGNCRSSSVSFRGALETVLLESRNVMIALTELKVIDLPASLENVHGFAFP